MNTPAKIIFLNGVSSVGKTSIAKALQTILLDDAFLHVGVDQFIDMLPEKYADHPDGLFFKPFQVNGTPFVEITIGKIGETAMRGMRHAIAALATQGNNLIIDEVIVGKEMEDYLKLLSPFHVFYVGVFAPLDVIEKRERSRKDRPIGLARWQYDLVHQNKSYDLEIDASAMTPLECAELIKAKFINTFPEPDPYQPDSVPLFEAIYGKNLISLGGIAAIDNMFSDLNIRELKALDIGFGLGGVAFHLAEKYQMDITGIEVHPWMVEYAKSHAPKNVALEFDIYNDKGELPYTPETFDLVYSKGVLNHVPDKESLFRQIHAILKPGGLCVIADWIFPHASSDSSAPLVCESRESYERVLTNAGFGEISFRDDSKLFVDYAKALLMNLTHHREFIEQKYGEELFSTLWKQHEELIDKIHRQQKFAARIVAKKISS